MPLAPLIARPVVVIVEDDADVLEALKFAFEIEGFAVRDYSSAEALLATSPPSDGACLVLDYRLPGIDGLTLLQRLRARGYDRPALLITTPNPETRRRAALASVNVVEKPLLQGALIDEVRHLLEPQAPALPPSL